MDLLEALLVEDLVDGAVGDHGFYCWRISGDGHCISADGTIAWFALSCPASPNEHY